METIKLIVGQRNLADLVEDRKDAVLCREAADRLEELDERVAIMSEGEQVTMEELVEKQ